MQAFIDNVKFGNTTDDYLTYRAGFPNSLISKLKILGIGTGKQHIVDLGTGTGTLAGHFVASGSKVIGIDPSINMIKAAISLAKKSNQTICYQVGSAEETNLDSHIADVVSAGQCWHWFDPVHAEEEIKRILKPNGHLVIVYYDWIPLNENIVESTEKLIEAHNPAWRAGGGFGMHPTILRDIQETGFEDI